MPKVRLLAPATDPSGQPQAQGAVVEVDDATAQEWRLSGKASLIEDEERQAQQTGGHYTDVTTREDVAPLTPGANPPGPQAAEDETDDRSDRRKK